MKTKLLLFLFGNPITESTYNIKDQLNAREIEILNQHIISIYENFIVQSNFPQPNQ